MNNSWWKSLGVVAAVSILGSIAGYPQETAVAALLLFLMSILGLNLGSSAASGVKQVMRGDAIAEALIGASAFAVVTGAAREVSGAGPAMAGALIAGALWSIAPTRPFVRLLLGPAALVTTGIELFGGGACTDALPESTRNLLIGLVTVGLASMGLIAVTVRRDLFRFANPGADLWRPTRWSLLCFGLTELALFSLSPAGIDLSEVWSVGPVVVLLALGSVVIVLAALSPDVAERAIGIGLLLTTVWLTLIQWGLAVGAQCGNPGESLLVIAAFGLAAGVAANANAGA